MKYGTVLKTWLLAYNALSLQTVPEESLRENRIIFVSENFPEDMESFNASRRGSVYGVIAPTLGGTCEFLVVNQIQELPLCNLAWVESVADHMFELIGAR